MKKILTAAAMALLLLGCAKQADDHSDILERIANLENRVSALESSVASIQSAVGEGVFVQKVQEYNDPNTGKTVGLTVTYTNGNVVYFKIEPVQDYNGPVLGVIQNGAGQLVWAVDGVAIKVNGQDVPVYQTPVFSIDDEGNLIVSIDGEKVNLGPIKDSGATLQDGIFTDLKVEQDKIVLTLSDGTKLNIPFAEAFKLNIEAGEYVYSDTKPITIPYTVSAKTANTVVNVAGYSPSSFMVEVTDANIIITPLKSSAAATMIAYADSRVGLTSIVNITVEPEGAYVVNPDNSLFDVMAEGDAQTVEVKVVSNVEFEAKPDAESAWIKVVSTKGTVHTITLSLEANATGDSRLGCVDLYKKGTDKVVQTIFIYQLAAEVGVKDLSKNGSANCYVVTAAGDYKFAAVKGNSTESVGAVASAAILWETWNNAEAVTANSVIAKVGVEEGAITFSTPEALKPGNAVIAAKDAAGAILWSWHIWIPATAIKMVSEETFYDKALMDRNLGALNVAPKTDPTQDTYGLMYQWGRKDPFPGSIKFAGVEIKKESAGTGDLAYTIANPTIWLKGSESAGQGNWNNEVIATLWNDDSNNKTIYDPCPAGYRVPIRNSSLAWFKSDSKEGWTFDAKAYSYTDDIVFPLCGYLEGNGPTGYYKEGQRTIIWSANSKSGEESDKGYGAYLRDSKYYSSGYFKYVGGVVRCVAE